MELLVVMTIIMILSGMLTAAVFTFRKMMAARAAKFDIQTFSMALAAYRRDMGSYPPDDDIPTAAGGWDTSYGMNEVLVYYLGRRHVIGDNVYGPYMEFKLKRLVDKDGDGLDEYLDPWRNHYLYAENASAGVGHNRRSYDLVCMGLDGVLGCVMNPAVGYDDETGIIDADAMEDNITNWKAGRAGR